MPSSKQRPKAEVRLYEVRGSLPPTETRHWRQNLSVMVLAPTISDALRHVLATRPKGTEVHDVFSRSGGRIRERMLAIKNGEDR